MLDQQKNAEKYCVLQMIIEVGCRRLLDGNNAPIRIPCQPEPCLWWGFLFWFGRGLRLAFFFRSNRGRGAMLLHIHSVVYDVCKRFVFHSMAIPRSGTISLVILVGAQILIYASTADTLYGYY
jgi:hypothetical protein